MTWRVVEQRDQDGAPYYVLEDVIQRLGYPGDPPGRLSILHHKPTPLLSTTVDGLRETLELMIEALAKPALRYRPAYLEEKKS